MCVNSCRFTVFYDEDDEGEGETDDEIALDLSSKFASFLLNDAPFNEHSTANVNKKPLDFWRSCRSPTSASVKSVR